MSYKEYSSDKCKAFLRVYENSNNICLVELYSSSRVKKPNRYMIKTSDFESFKDNFFKKYEENERIKKERRDARKNHSHPFEVGDILYSSYGYNMTIVHFYRVESLIGNKTVQLSKLNSIAVSGDGWTGTKIPDLETNSEEIFGKFRVTEHDSVKINSYEYAYKWNGKPVYFNYLD